MSAAQILAEIKPKYILSLPKCHDIRRGMLDDMFVGIETNGANSSCKMLPSRVLHLPNGREQGIYYAIDWGGSNVRFIRVRLTPGKSPQMDFVKYKIPKSLQTGDHADALFGFLAQKMRLFMQTFNEFDSGTSQSFSVGLTFSFPTKQTSLNRGILLQWTKGFAVDGVVNQDVVALMNAAFEKENIPAQVGAICNDTVGTLITCSYKHRNTMMGVIIGTGTNAAYVEPCRDDEVINTEWGNFDETQKYLPRVESTDMVMDTYTVNQGVYFTEKMLSGMYVGEICRLLMMDLFRHKIPKQNSIILNAFSEFSGSQVTILLREYYQNSRFYGVRNILKILRGAPYNLVEMNEQDVMVMVEMFQLILHRSADLAACLILATLQKSGFYSEVESNTFKLAPKYERDYVTVGVDGGVFLNMPQYPQRIRQTMVELVGERIVNRIQLQHAEDGSGLGAALCVAAQNRYDKQRKLDSKL